MLRIAQFCGARDQLEDFLKDLLDAALQAEFYWFVYRVSRDVIRWGFRGTGIISPRSKEVLSPLAALANQTDVTSHGLWILALDKLCEPVELESLSQTGKLHDALKLFSEASAALMRSYLVTTEKDLLRETPITKSFAFQQQFLLQLMDVYIAVERLLAHVLGLQRANDSVTRDFQALQNIRQVLDEVRAAGIALHAVRRRFFDADVESLRALRAVELRCHVLAGCVEILLAPSFASIDLVSKELVQSVASPDAVKRYMLSTSQQETDISYSPDIERTISLTTKTLAHESFSKVCWSISAQKFFIKCCDWR